MKSPIAIEALAGSIKYHQTLGSLANCIRYAKAYRLLARTLLEMVEELGCPPADFQDRLERVDRLFAELEEDSELQLLPDEAMARLDAVRPLLETSLPEDELARLLKALREDGFQWQPPRAV
jgi:hypothetical protein